MPLLSRLKTHYDNASLQRKIALVMGIGGLLVTAAMATAAFLLSRQLIISNTESTLRLHTQQQEREIFLRVDSAVALAGSLANNPITANALADSYGRSTYLTPLINAQSLPFPGASLSLTDYKGRLIASNTRQVESDTAALRPLLDQTIAQGKPMAMLIPASSEKEHTIIATFPVIYRLTGDVEGCVVLSIPLGELLPGPSYTFQYAILDAEYRMMAGKYGGESAIQATTQLTLPLPLNTLPLNVAISQDRATALRELDTLVLVFLVIGTLLLIAVTVFSRAAARFLSHPLSKLAATADQITQTGRPNAVLEVERDDEFGRLARALQAMLNRLANSYNDLEQRVEERTLALQTSEQKMASILASMLDAVWSLDRTGHHATYVSPSMTDMTGIRDIDFRRDLSRFFALIHGDDLAGFREAIRRMVADQETIEIEFRYHHPARGARVLLSRGHPVFGADGQLLRFDGILTDVTQRSEAESQLRTRELYLRAILDNFPFLIWLKDDQSRFLAANKRFAEACGVDDPNAVRGMTDLDVWPRELADMYRADDFQVMASGCEKNVEEPIIVDGERRWIETFKKPVVTAEGQILGTVGFARDITERKAIERQLAASEQRWELAVAGANDGIWDWNMATNELFLSDRWKSMLGYLPDEISNRYVEWESRIHPDDLPRVMHEVNRHIEGLSSLYQTELRMRCKDGSYRWILARGKAVRNAEGKLTRFLGSHSDIHEQFIAETRLKLRTDQLNAIFSLSPDGFVAFGDTGAIEYTSPAFSDMTGLATFEVHGLDEQQFLGRLAHLVSPESRGSQLTLAALQAGGHPGDAPRNRSRQLLELIKPQPRTLEIGRRSNEGKNVSKIYYFRDVTHETEVDRLKSEFLSTAAHELRTPMVSILGFSEWLLNNPEAPPEVLHELLGTIYRQSNLMAAIINELLDLARIEARRGQDFIIEPIDLNKLVSEAVRVFKAPDDDRPVIVSLSGQPAEIHGDRRKITQAINNVLSNAYKYSPDGGEISLRLQPAPRQGCPGFCIQVRDHGIGMSPESVARVCERFFRADTSGQILGTGLGMSIVKEIVELHGGQIAVESTLGQGTQISLWFPEKQAPCPAATIPNPNEALTP